MAYEKQTWETGDVITADKLNHVESGVRGINDEYTPTTWVNGDTITASKLNNIEDGIANASGGGGLSTASVEFICSSGSYSVTVASIYDDFIVIAPMNLLPGASFTLDIPLGDDGAILAYDCFVGLGETPIVTTGDIVADDDNGEFIITGDGTITAEGEVFGPH